MRNSLLRWFLYAFFRIFYRLEIEGLHHLTSAGPKAVIVPNHVSFLDPGLVRALLPHDPVFAIDRGMAQLWWVKRLMRFGRTVALDCVAPFSIRTLLKAVKSGEMVIIFPEGRLTVTGRMMKIYDGAAFVAGRANAVVVPVHIGGLEHSTFTRMTRGQITRRWFPKVKVSVLRPQTLQVDPSLTGRQRLRASAAVLRRIMSDVAVRIAPDSRSMGEAIRWAAAAHGARRPVLVDDAGSRSYRQILNSSWRARRLMPLVGAGTALGLALPNSRDTVALILGLLETGRSPALLDPENDPEAMLLQCRAANVSTLIVTRAMLKAGELAAAAEKLRLNMRFVAIGQSPDPSPGCSEDIAQEDAAIVFLPRGAKEVVLSQQALLAHAAEMLARVELIPADKVFSAFPLSRPAGFVAGVLLPLLCGARSMLHVALKPARRTTEAIYIAQPTVLFETNARLATYAKIAHPDDFGSLRSIFACDGAVPADLQDIYWRKFGVRVESLSLDALTPVPLTAWQGEDRSTEESHCAASLGSQAA